MPLMAFTWLAEEGLVDPGRGRPPRNAVRNDDILLKEHIKS